MSHGRQFHTATLLKDGRVLVVGGWACVFDGCFDPPPWWYVRAEIFDPSTDTWTPISGPYLSFHTATLLNDGRVLVPGCPSMVFDPATGTWTQTGNMVHCHGGTATLLADRRVLVVGGRDADLYDPLTDTWSATGGPADSRVGHTATRLASGNVLVAGGVVDCPDLEAPQLNTSEEFNPGTGTWSSRTFMAKGRNGHTAALLNDGRVLIAGGVEKIVFNIWSGACSEEVWTETAEIYTP